MGNLVHAEWWGYLIQFAVVLPWLLIIADAIRDPKGKTASVEHTPPPLRNEVSDIQRKLDVIRRAQQM